MTIREMLIAQAAEMRDELASLVEYERYGDDGYDDLSNGLEFLESLLELDYNILPDDHDKAVEAIFNNDQDLHTITVEPVTFHTRPTHMLGLDSLAPKIRDEYYRRYPDERI